MPSRFFQPEDRAILTQEINLQEQTNRLTVWKYNAFKDTTKNNKRLTNRRNYCFFF